MKADAYTFLSQSFEQLIRCDYEKWSQYLYNRLKSHGAGKKGLDAGCGTGYFTRAFKRLGLDVSGVDISDEMLAAAAKAAADENLNISFTRQDIKSLKSFEPLDFVTAVNDVINYLDGGGLLKAFSSVKKCLKKGGLFLFDISTEYKLKNIIGNNLFAEDTDSTSYIWFNTLHQNRVIMDLSIFIKQGGCYVKREESHTQYIHSYADISAALDKSGFELIAAESFLGGDITATTERILFICKRK